MKKVTLVGVTWCGYCRGAKELLSKLSIEFDDIDVTNDDQLRADYSKKANGHTTVPMVFIGDIFVGGYTELAGLHKKGDLQVMLEG